MLGSHYLTLLITDSCSKEGRSTREAVTRSRNKRMLGTVEEVCSRSRKKQKLSPAKEDLTSSVSDSSKKVSSPKRSLPEKLKSPSPSQKLHPNSPGPCETVSEPSKKISSPKSSPMKKFPSPLKKRTPNSPGPFETVSEPFKKISSPKSSHPMKTFPSPLKKRVPMSPGPFLTSPMKSSTPLKYSSLSRSNSCQKDFSDDGSDQSDIETGIKKNCRRIVKEGKVSDEEDGDTDKSEGEDGEEKQLKQGTKREHDSDSDSGSSSLDTTLPVVYKEKGNYSSDSDDSTSKIMDQMDKYKSKLKDADLEIASLKAGLKLSEKSRFEYKEENNKLELAINHLKTKLQYYEEKGSKIYEENKKLKQIISTARDALSTGHLHNFIQFVSLSWFITVYFV